jgi:membrane-bound serine protease (ClpP class)
MAPMILLIGIGLALFVIPWPWNVPVVIGAAFLEVGETLFTWRWSQRGKVKVGPETLIGATGRVVTPCQPEGTVRIRGEIWQARCEAGADTADRVRVIGREELVLVVEPIAV